MHSFFIALSLLAVVPPNSDKYDDDFPSVFRKSHPTQKPVEQTSPNFPPPYRPRNMPTARPQNLPPERQATSVVPSGKVPGPLVEPPPPSSTAAPTSPSEGQTLFDAHVFPRSANPVLPQAAPSGQPSLVPQPVPSGQNALQPPSSAGQGATQTSPKSASPQPPPPSSPAGQTMQQALSEPAYAGQAPSPNATTFQGQSLQQTLPNQNSQTINNQQDTNLPTYKPAQKYEYQGLMNQTQEEQPYPTNVPPPPPRPSQGKPPLPPRRPDPLELQHKGELMTHPKPQKNPSPQSSFNPPFPKKTPRRY